MTLVDEDDERGRSAEFRVFGVFASILGMHLRLQGVIGVLGTKRAPNPYCRY
jgi:hypothetical protein